MNVLTSEMSVDGAVAGELFRRESRPRLGEILRAQTDLTEAQLDAALARQARSRARLGDILTARGVIDAEALVPALCAQWQTTKADLTGELPDPRLIDAYGAAACLSHGIVPWKRAGSVTVIATAHPERFALLKPKCEAVFGPVAMAITSEGEVHHALETLRSNRLAEEAESRVSEETSCRSWRGVSWSSAALMLAALAALSFVLSIQGVVLALGTLAVLALVATTLLRFITFVLMLRHQPKETTREIPPRRPLPVISVMVPLFREEDIAGRLLQRLGALDYPEELLDILLVTEADDTQTISVLERTELPRWARIVRVPEGQLRTKPRALNYALDFCRGSIVGVWDAEDKPEQAQLLKVAAHFAEADPDVACLQGRLDFYNARTNWLSRCFAVEYGGWFRVILPGLERLGLVLPLGGTTLFFRRDVLEDIGAWDAHNVTEDADLGIRLARAGFRTEMVDTQTLEEANCRVAPWIRQRSRWLKGYALTWAVHMRQPKRLLRDLGAWRFMGIQVFFAAALSQIILAPLLWSFWLIPLGLPHFASTWYPDWALWGAFLLFLSAEVVGIGIGLLGALRNGHRWLWPWVPTLHAYFPLAALAIYKGLFEVLLCPFYWDKTKHGVFDEGGSLIRGPQ